MINNTQKNINFQDKILKRCARKNRVDIASSKSNKLYTGSALVGVSQVIEDASKRVKVLDDDAKSSRQTKAQEAKHVFSKKIIHPKIKKYFSGITSAEVFFNYSKVRDVIGESLNLPKSSFKVQDLSINNFIEQTSNYATYADGVTILMVAVGIVGTWYFGHKANINLKRKFIEEKLALYGDDYGSSGVNKGEIQKAIDYYSGIAPLNSVFNSIYSAGKKTKNTLSLLIQHTLLIIHKFANEEIYKHLKNVLSDDVMAKLKEFTEFKINKIDKKLKKLRKNQRYYKTIYQRQVGELKKLEKHSSDLEPGETYAKRLNADVSKINSMVYLKMLKMGVFSSLNKAVSEIYLLDSEKDSQKIDKALEIISGISTLSQVVSTDGVNKYTIISKVAKNVLQDYSRVKVDLKSKKKVKGYLNLMFRTKIFKYGQSEMNKIIDPSTNAPSYEDRIRLLNNLIDMKFVGMKSNRRVLSEEIKTFIDVKNLITNAVRLSSFKSFAQVLNHVSGTIEDEYKTEISRKHKDSVLMHAISEIKVKNNINTKINNGGTCDCAKIRVIIKR